MKKTLKLFFAVAKGHDTSENTPVRRYIGVAPVFVLAVNPNRERLSQLYNFNIQEEPKYLGEMDVEGKKIKTLRFDFIVSTVKEDIPEKLRKTLEEIPQFVTRITFFVRNAYRVNKDNTKIQVIDRYGRTAWLTKEEFQAKKLPEYAGPYRLDKDYRAALWGEEELTSFIKTYLGIPNVEKWENSQIVGVKTGKEAEMCEVRFDHPENWFKGDISEVETCLQYQPLNRIKVLFGIRTTDSNKQYQDVYTRMFLSSGTTDYTRLQKSLDSTKASGGYPNTEFEVCPVKEYVNAPSSIPEAPAEIPDSGAADDLPFGDSTAPSWD